MNIESEILIVEFTINQMLICTIQRHCGWLNSEHVFAYGKVFGAPASHEKRHDRCSEMAINALYCAQQWTLRCLHSTASRHFIDNNNLQLTKLLLFSFIVFVAVCAHVNGRYWVRTAPWIRTKPIICAYKTAINGCRRYFDGSDAVSESFGKFAAASILPFWWNGRFYGSDRA